MHNHLSNKTPRKRQRYSKDFKAGIVAACDQPGVSVAGVALANGLNTNLVHKWRREAQADIGEHSGAPDFLPIAMPEPTGATPRVVTFEVASLKVHWPLDHIDRAIGWLRALQS